MEDFDVSAPFTAEFDISDFEELAGDLAGDGYERGAPGMASSIDATIAKAGICPKCGTGLEYAPYYKPGSYRAFAVCYSCNQALEF